MAARPLPLRSPSPAPSRESCTLLTIPDTAGLLRLSRDSVYALITAGSLRAVLVKGKYRIRLTDLHHYIQRLA